MSCLHNPGLHKGPFIKPFGNPVQLGVELYGQVHTVAVRIVQPVYTWQHRLTPVSKRFKSGCD